MSNTQERDALVAKAAFAEHRAEHKFIRFPPNEHAEWNFIEGYLTARATLAPTAPVVPTDVVPCGNRDYCSRFPFCGCGGPEKLPERDTTKTAEQQGLFRKFDVKRTDGSDKPGGKHYGCEYFVLDMKHDPHAAIALAAYAEAVEKTHPVLARDLCNRYELMPLAAASPSAPIGEPE